MCGRVPVWGGVGVAVAALAGLGAYFATVGLDEADKMASVIGVFVALAGLGVAVYGLLAQRGSGGGTVEQRAKASGHGRVYQAGRNINAKPQERPSDRGDDTAMSGAVDEGERLVRQRVKAAENSQVHQAGRDVNER